MPRHTPYTVLGISRLKCFRCNNRARYQWQICSDGRVFRPLCVDCDIALNALVLNWMGFKDAAQKLEVYRKKVLGI